MHVHICMLQGCVWGGGGGVVLASTQPCLLPVYAGEMGLTWQERGMGAVPWKVFCRSWAVGLRGSCSLSQPPLPISQPPVGLLPLWTAAGGMCGEQKGIGCQGSFSQLPSANPLLSGGLSVDLHAWGMAGSSRPTHGFAP